MSKKKLNLKPGPIVPIPHEFNLPQINPKDVIARKIIAGLIKPSEQIQQVGIDLTIAESVEIPHGSFRNVQLNEKFDMQNTFGLLWIRSSLSRQGIFMSCGVFDPGFKGIGGVSFYNLSGKAAMIFKDFRVCQIVCFRADASSLYKGFYQHSGSIKSQYDAKGGSNDAQKA